MTESQYIFECDKCAAKINSHQPEGVCKCGTPWKIERKTDVQPTRHP